jgi:hypothetical protein
MAKKSRPLGYIFPKRIKSAIMGENTRKTFYYGGQNEEEEDKKRREAEAKEKLDKETMFQEVRELYIPPNFCPICSKNMKRLDNKAWLKRGICFDCVVRVEAHLKTIGKYTEYEEQLTLRNYKAYLIDVRGEAKEFVSNLKDEIKVVNHDGTFDKLSGDQEKVRDFMNEEIKDLDKKLEEVKDIDMEKTVYEIIDIDLKILAKELYETQKEFKEQKLQEMKVGEISK